MKTLLLDESQAHGRTVEAIHIDEPNFSVVFTDGSALVCEVDYDDESCSVYPLNKSELISLYSQHRLGLLTDEEFALAKKADEERIRTENIQRDRAAYERLRKQFESPTAADAVDPHATDYIKPSTRES